MVAIKRKIIQHGPSTLVVSLPSCWAKKYGLKKGEELEVLEQGRVLAVSTRRQTAPRAIDIDLSSASILTRRIIKKVYQHGYDSACFRFSSPEQRDGIRAVSKELIGFETIEQGESHCVLKDISGSKEEDFSVLFRRFFLLAKMLASDFASLSEDGLKQVLEKEEDINKLANFCIRKLNRGEVDDFVSNSKYHMLIYFIESACDIYKELARDIIHGKAVPGKNSQKLFKDFAVLMSLAYEATFSKSLQESVQAGKLFEALKSGLDAAQDTAEEMPVCLKLKGLLQLIIPVIELQLLDFKGVIKKE